MDTHCTYPDCKNQSSTLIACQGRAGCGGGAHRLCHSAFVGDALTGTQVQCHGCAQQQIATSSASGAPSTTPLPGSDGQVSTVREGSMGGANKSSGAGASRPQPPSKTPAKARAAPSQPHAPSPMACGECAWKERFPGLGHSGRCAPVEDEQGLARLLSGKLSAVDTLCPGCTALLAAKEVCLKCNGCWCRQGQDGNADCKMHGPPGGHDVRHVTFTSVRGRAATAPAVGDATAACKLCSNPVISGNYGFCATHRSCAASGGLQPAEQLPPPEATSVCDQCSVASTACQSAVRVQTAKRRASYSPEEMGERARWHLVPAPPLEDTRRPDISFKQYANSFMAELYRWYRYFGKVSTSFQFSGVTARQSAEQWHLNMSTLATAETLRDPTTSQQYHNCCRILFTDPTRREKAVAAFTRIWEYVHTQRLAGKLKPHKRRDGTIDWAKLTGNPEWG